MRARWFVAVGLVVALAAVAGGGRTPARAATASVVEVGWWSRNPGTTTPADGFQVAKDPSGETSVAAVRVQYEGPFDTALLILTEATTGYLKEGAVVEACRITGEWKATSAGALADAPARDCSDKLTLTRDGTIGSWRVDLRPFLTEPSGTIGIALVPGVATTVTPPAPPQVPSPVPLVPLPTAPAVPVPPVSTPVDPGFSVDFTKASLQATAPADDSGSSSGGFDSGSAGPGTIASDFGSAFAPTFTPTDSFASTFSAATATPSPSVLPSATAEVSTGGAGGAGTAASVENGLQPVAATTGPPPPWGRLLLLVPLSAAIGAFGTGLRRRLVSAPAG